VGCALLAALRLDRLDNPKDTRCNDTDDNGTIDHHVSDEIWGRVFLFFLLVVTLLWMRVKM